MNEHEKSLWLAHELEQSIETRNRLIEWYLPYAHAITEKIAKRIPKTLVDGDDLFQESVFAIINCIDRFDPTGGRKFTSFVSQRIRGQVLDHLRQLDWVNRADRPLMNRVERELEAASRHLTDAEVGEATGMTEESCHRLRGGWQGWIQRGAGAALDLCRL